MKRLLLIIPLAFQLGCGSIKENKVPQSQLLKDVEILASKKYEGRKPGTKGHDLAKTYLITRLQEVGVPHLPSMAGYEQTFDIKGENQPDVKGTNLVSYVKGKTDDVIVISAHYDHIGVVNKTIYPGADDNASGVAALLELAKYFKENQPHHTFIFALFDAEEIGLLGAKAFVNAPPVPIENIKLNINMDMISRNDKSELYVAGTYKYPEFKKYLYSGNKEVKLLTGHDNPHLGADDWTNQSDHAAFNTKKIPFLYFGVENHKDYHQPSDEFKNIDPYFFTNAVEVIRDVITNIDSKRDLQSTLRDKLRMNRQ